MPEGSVRVDLRMIVATWPQDAPRGAVTRFCRQHGVSTSWFYEVRARARQDGPLAAVSPRSRRPTSSPRTVRAELEDLAVRIRKELADQGLDCGPINVRARMLELGISTPSRATLARIFARRGMVVPQPNKRPRSSWRRFCFAAPNECWQLDATEVTLLDGTVAVVFQLLDDHSRLLLASRAAVNENATDALAVVITAIDRYGVPQRLLSDNHLALNPTRRGQRGLLETHLRGLGVQPIASSPHHPQTCGKNERVHQTLKRWLDARPPAQSLPDLQALLNTFDELYNTVRPHQALNGRTPAHAWRSTPVAAAPHPPTTTTSTTPAPLARTRPAVRQALVYPAGHLNVLRVQICLGVRYAGHLITVIEDADLQQLHLYTSTGQHLRTITRQPGKIYYGNGRPIGGRRQPRLPSSGKS